MNTIAKITCALLSSLTVAGSAMPIWGSAVSTQEVKQAINDYQASPRGAELYSTKQQSSAILNIEGYDLDQICRYDGFTLSPTLCSSTERFSSLIEDDVRYYVPYENEDATGMIQLRENGSGELYVLGYTIAKELVPNDIIDTQKVSAMVASAFSEETANGIRYLENTMYDLRLAYFENDGTEYIIPFTVSRVEDTYEGFTDGTIYKAADFKQWIVNSFEETPSTNEKGELLFGGLPFHYIDGFEIAPYQTDISLFWIYPAISALLLAGAVVFFMKIRKRSASAPTVQTTAS